MYAHIFTILLVKHRSVKQNVPRIVWLLHRQRHDVFLLFLSCSALDSEAAEVSQPRSRIPCERLVDEQYRSYHAFLQHHLVVDEVKRVIGVIRLALPYRLVEVIDEIPCWWVLHLYETLGDDEDGALRLVGHKEVLHNLVECAHVHLSLFDALLLQDVGG